MNALFLKDLAIKTHRGIEGRVRQGKSGGGRAYGYCVVDRRASDGTPIRGDREINEREAVIIRRIFAEFAAGKSPRAIARDLNQEGLKGPSSKPWRDTTIRGHAARRTGILRNDLYVGRLLWNKQSYRRNPDTGKRVARPREEREHIVTDVPELRIVDQSVWEAVQSRLDAIRASPGSQKLRRSEFWKHRRPRHLLTGLVACGECGGLGSTCCNPSLRRAIGDGNAWMSAMQSLRTFAGSLFES
jgi:site-specific DNA recombinase